METKQERSKRDLWSMKMEISMELCISGSEEKQKKDMTCCYKNEAKKKNSFPGCYDISSAGHISAGDEPLETALRELEEELGIKAEPEQLKKYVCMKEA